MESAQGPVRQVIFRLHLMHGIDDDAYNALDRAGWNALIETRHKDQSCGFRQPTASLLLDWAVSVSAPRPGRFHGLLPPEITPTSATPRRRRCSSSLHVMPRIDRVNEALQRRQVARRVRSTLRQRGAKLKMRNWIACQWLSRSRARIRINRAGRQDGRDGLDKNTRADSFDARSCRRRAGPARHVRRGTASDALNLRPPQPTSSNRAADQDTVIRWSNDERTDAAGRRLKPHARHQCGGVSGAAQGLPARAGRIHRRRRLGAARGRAGAVLEGVRARTLRCARRSDSGDDRRHRKSPTLGLHLDADVNRYSNKYAYHPRCPRHRANRSRHRPPSRRLFADMETARARSRGEGGAHIDRLRLHAARIRLDAVGSGEGKSSLTTKVVADDAAATVALDNSSRRRQLAKSKPKRKGQSKYEVLSGCC